MPRTCTVCTHPERDAINQALLSREPYRIIAQRFAASPDAVYRHKQDHLPTRLVKAHEAHEVARADSLLVELDRLKTEAHRIKQKAERSGDYRTALTGVRELVRIVELLAKLNGELRTGIHVNVFVTAQWQQVRAVLINALQPYPDARQAVALALGAIEDGHEPRT